MHEAVVLDASALIALMDAEPGQEAVAAVLPGARMSAVNLAEVVSKLAERGMPAAEAHADALALGIDVTPFDAELALDVGSLRPITRSAGLSLGDRCCLALARRHRVAALTTEARWMQVEEAVGVAIRDIRAEVS
ncbi:MAG: type II toxin-antitoxin system VapC family toxin [Geminicoccaceae bacterium]